MTEIGDKVVMITGASRGIGRATALAFAEAGARVALIARDEGAVADLAGEIGADQALAVPCDVVRFWEVEAAVGATLEAWGRLDVLINNAGIIGEVGHLAETDPEAWAQAIEINLKGVYHGMRAALPVMVEAGAGTIINISSGAAYRPVEGWSSYCASKAGVLMLTQAGHHEYGDRGIRCLGLSPGTVATQMQKDIKSAGIGPVARLDWSDHIPPETPARALLWMCGAEADDWLGRDVSLRDDDVRAQIGL